MALRVKAVFDSLMEACEELIVAWPMKCSTRTAMIGNAAEPRGELSSVLELIRIVNERDQCADGQVTYFLCAHESGSALVVSRGKFYVGVMLGYANVGTHQWLRTSLIARPSRAGYASGASTAAWQTE